MKVRVLEGRGDDSGDNVVYVRNTLARQDMYATRRNLEMDLSCNLGSSVRRTGSEEKNGNVRGRGTE